MSDDLVKMCRRLSKYAHAQLSATDLERIADRIEELEAKLEAVTTVRELMGHMWGEAEDELSKVVSILQDAKQMCIAGHPVSAFNLASTVLAELKGEADD